VLLHPKTKKTKQSNTPMKYYTAVLTVLFCLLAIPNVDAQQRRSKPEPEIAPDSLRMMLATQGKEATLHTQFTCVTVLDQLN
jgi:hypothetical protein